MKKLLLMMLALAGPVFADQVLHDETIGDLRVKVTALDNGKYAYSYQVEDWFSPDEFEDPEGEWRFARGGMVRLSREDGKVARGFGQVKGGKLLRLMYRNDGRIGGVWGGGAGALHDLNRGGRLTGQRGPMFRVPLNGRLDLSFVSRAKPVKGVFSYGYSLSSPWGHQSSWALYPICWVPGVERK